jgi:enoyl-CoA hydratase
LEGARALASRIVSNGPLAVRATKQIIADAVGWNDPAAFAAQAAHVAPVMRSSDAQEGARAFAEKRPPVWTGA